MDKLLTETETKVEKEAETTKVAEEKKTEKQKVVVSAAPPQNASYISSFENMTIADVKKETVQEIEEETQPPEEIVETQPLQEVQDERFDEAAKSGSATVIEKPNYDLLESKVIKLKKNVEPKKKRSKKFAALVLACALGGAAIICVTNCVILDQMNSNFVQIEDSYNLKLGKYLRDINNLDATKNSMEMIETYPDELLDAGDLGQKSNWFDRLCNFIGGLFGG